MSTTALDRLLHLYPSGSPKPVIVLDVARPVTPTETARHLLLRNEFAGQLFALGNVPALIGTASRRSGTVEASRSPRPDLLGGTPRTTFSRPTTRRRARNFCP